MTLITTVPPLDLRPLHFKVFANELGKTMETRFLVEFFRLTQEHINTLAALLPGTGTFLNSPIEGTRGTVYIRRIK